MAQQLDVAGDLLGQLHQFAGDQRHHDHQHQANHDDEDEGHHRRRQRARQPHPLQAVAHRIEEVGDGHADQEGREDVAQRPQQQDEDAEPAQPVDELPLRGHAPPSSHSRAARPQVQT